METTILGFLVSLRILGAGLTGLSSGILGWRSEEILGLGSVWGYGDLPVIVPVPTVLWDKPANPYTLATLNSLHSIPQNLNPKQLKSKPLTLNP